MKMAIHHKIQSARRDGRKMLSLLIDPDKLSREELAKLCAKAGQAKVDLIFVGGSLLIEDALDECLENIKSQCSIPVVLFPGSILQISAKADALLFLSLISGRNPELLIGNHVKVAPYLKNLNLELLPTGYMLIDSGVPTTASYISGSAPLPGNKPEIAACTAMAGEMLGLQYIYLDGGSGALKPVTASMIAAIRKSVDLPIIVGGGISTPEKAQRNCQAGADIIVVGNAIEKNPDLLKDMAKAVHDVGN